MTTQDELNEAYKTIKAMCSHYNITLHSMDRCGLVVLADHIRATLKSHEGVIEKATRSTDS